jgi:hypothetical protein
METQETDLSNEAAALADILKWSADLPAWQPDALRRLCSQHKLESADITALVAVCKAIDQAASLDASQASATSRRGIHWNCGCSGGSKRPTLSSLNESCTSILD